MVAMITYSFHKLIMEIVEISLRIFEIVLQKYLLSSPPCFK